MADNNYTNVMNYIHPFHSWGMPISHAEGIYLFDNLGNKWTDITSSASVVNIGYDDVRVKDVIRGQLDKLIFASPTAQTQEADTLAEKLIQLLPVGLDTILRSTTGSEAVEVALKLARKYTHRSKFLSFRHSYHGHTMGAMAIGMHEGTKKDFLPLIDSDIIHHPYIVRGSKGYEEAKAESLSQIESRLSTGEYAAFVTEYLMSSPGSFPLDVGFMQALRKLCDEYGTLLVVDEVLTGFGRTGKMFAFEYSGVTPDIITLAKGLGSGYSPIAATVTSKAIAEGFDYFATFAWNPLACVVASRVLDIYEEDNLVQNSHDIGELIVKQLHAGLDDNSHVADIRGLGLKLAIEIDDNKSFNEIMERLRKEYIYVGAADLPNIIHIAPPLIITEQQATELTKTIIDVINNKDIQSKDSA